MKHKRYFYIEKSAIEKIEEKNQWKRNGSQ